VVCSQCSSQLATEARVCGICGAPVQEQLFPLLPSLAAESTFQTAVAPVPVPQPPYAAFVSLALGLGLCLSIVAFNVSYNLAQGEWRVYPWSVLAYPAAVLCMLLMPRTWRRIESIPDELGRDKSLLRRAAVFSVLFVVIALIVGRKIGADGRATGQLIDDFHEMSRIGKRISQVRNSVEGNVPAHIVMYKEIEPDVIAFNAILQKLDAELPSYDDKFPSQHQQTLRTMNSVKIGLARAGLLERQIEVAREIEALAPAPRWKAWQERMQPLLEAETALDKR